MSTFPLESLYNWYRNLVSNPKYRWWVIAGTLVYLLSPLDIAPDFIPFIGQIDDAIVVTLLATELAQVLRDWSGKVKAGKTPTTKAEPESIEVEAIETQ
ncbi:MAG: DUF1232 domain-containing protein [Alkalinema sp. RU_4_3]|nr:DUF1232 domain-containing protein [Alkalinema sp. RU_4_3]